MTKYIPGSQGLLAPIQSFLDDGDVSEILMNKPGEVWVEKSSGMTCHEVPEFNNAHIHRLFQLIANENRQLLSEETPLLSGQLRDGSRVQLVLSPTAKSPAMSIRRQVMHRVNLDHYQKRDFYKTMTACQLDEAFYGDLSPQEKNLTTLFHQKSWGDFIGQAILDKKNIVISGGTSSGKTTFLNACLQAMPASDRLLILEDTREVQAPQCNQVQLLASKGQQGMAKVSMQNLVQCCLRLRPDRIIMGEIRGPEILDFVSACSTGHEGSITTIHANNPRIAFMRMAQMYKLNNVPSMSDEDIARELKAVIDIVIQLNKTPAGRLASSIYFKPTFRT